MGIIKNGIKKLNTGTRFSEVARYLIVGGLTTLVSFGSFWVFSYPLKTNVNAANALSILLAVIFAYVTNKIYVFKSRQGSLLELIKEAAAFFASRGFTMAVEFFGVFFFYNIVGLKPMLSKVLISFIVIVLNYILSKVFVFKKALGKKED